MPTARRTGAAAARCGVLLRNENAVMQDPAADELGDLRAANERLLKTPLRGLRREPRIDSQTAQSAERELETAVNPTGPEPDPMPAAATQPRFTIKPDEGKAGRRGMDALREQALQNLISQVEDRNFGGLRNRRIGGGLLTPSRVILIAVALIAGGVAAYLAATLQPPPPPPPEVVRQVVSMPTTRVLVASKPILLGERISASALEWTEWPEAALRPEFITDAVRPAAATEMTGAVARAEITAGEPILAGKLVHADGSYLAGMLGTAMRGVSVPVTAESASGGFIAPNDRVDVISTRVNATGQYTETILLNVRVLALDKKLAKESDDEGETDPGVAAFSGKALATLELSQKQAELVVNALAVGQLTLAIRSITDTEDTASAEERAANQVIRSTSPFWR